MQPMTTQDQSGRLSPSEGAVAAFSGRVEAENEPFLSPSDLATARRPRSLDGNNEGRRERSAGRPRRARGDAAVRARLLHALPPRLSQWLQPSTQDDDLEPPRRDRHGPRAPPTLRVPVTLRALPGHASRPASLHEIRVATHRRAREDEDEDEDALPALVSLTDVTPPLTRRVGSAESMATPQQQQQHEHVHASPAGSPRSTASSDDASQSEEMSTLDEFHTLFRRCHHTLPFVALFVLYFVYQHIAGLAVFALGSVAVGGLDTRLRAQIALKENANRLYLVGIAAICIVDTIVISSLDGEPNPFRHLTFKLHTANAKDATTKEPPHSGALILELLWIVLVNDFIMRFWSLAVKALVAAVRPDGMLFALRRSCSDRGRSDSGVLPGSPELDLEEGQRRKLTRSNVAFYRRKRKLYGIIELTSIFFRSLIAGLPWCSFYQLGSSKFMADVFTFLYVFGKSVILGSQGRRLIKLVRSFLTLGLEHATYVTRDELAEAGCPDCSICYETMHTPVKLSCSHLFCEECVMEWFDRERSCPLCRAAIVPAAQADSEPKPQFLDGSTSLFPQLF